MTQLNITFEDKVYKQMRIERLKTELDLNKSLTWEQYILYLIERGKKTKNDTKSKNESNNFGF